MKISDVRFDSEFEEEGIWWLPENQSMSLVSTLKICLIKSEKT